MNTLRCPLAVHREVEQVLSPVSTYALLLGPQRLSGLLPHVQGVVGHILLPLPAGGDRRNIAISAKVKKQPCVFSHSSTLEARWTRAERGENGESGLTSTCRPNGMKELIH